MAIQVKVEFIGLLREITGENQLTLNMEEGATLKDVVEKLADKYGRVLRPGSWRKTASPTTHL
jgi:molybdopterin converting factor small subunit